MSEKRNKMLTMWVTEDEHRRLLERCDGRQLAAWMRQTCLDEKPARSGKLPSISPALLRQLAGMGNNLNQIAFRFTGVNPLLWPRLSHSTPDTRFREGSSLQAGLYARTPRSARLPRCPGNYHLESNPEQTRKIASGGSH